MGINAEKRRIQFPRRKIPKKLRAVLWNLRRDLKVWWARNGK